MISASQSCSSFINVNVTNKFFFTDVFRVLNAIFLFLPVLMLIYLRVVLGLTMVKLLILSKECSFNITNASKLN